MINQQIIKLASDTSNYGIKKDSNFIATSKNKICGDKITIQLEIKKKIIKKNISDFSLSLKNYLHV